MEKKISVGKKEICSEGKTFIVAEMSANHNMDFNRAKEIVKAAAEAGADAIKIQTYTPDTITIESDKPAFRTKGIWEGRTLYELYGKAYTPWEWQADLQKYAYECGIEFFSSPFDLTAIDFLEDLNVPAYKVASFEINDIPFIRKIARTGKPIIISTGIAYLEDVDLALRTCLEEGNDKVILLKCISSYPAPYENMNLKVIPNMAETFDCICGLSDHSMGTEIAVAAVAMGAKVIEKHFTLNRADGGEDAQFSMEPQEFRSMVDQIRNVEKALGKPTYLLNKEQMESRIYSRSLFAVKDIKKGDEFDEDNVKSIRPGIGMHTKYWEDVLGKKARTDIEKGTPMSWDLVE